MASDKLFTIGGTSTVNGVVTLRVATGSVKVRAGVLKRAGHTDINLRELPQPMTKADAAVWLASQGIEAVVPVKGGGKQVELTDEQKAAAEKARVKAEEKAAKAAEKARLAAERQLAEDHNFMATLTGEPTVPVPAAEEGSAEALIEAASSVPAAEAEPQR